MNADNDATGPGRLAIRADDPNLTPYAGLVIVGELARRTRLVELIDAELGVVRTARAVKRRRRGLSAGALVVSLAECQIAGAECFDDVENVRADRAGASLRAVAATPSAPAARQLARRYRPGHIRAIERAQARVGGRLDRAAGRDPADDVTFDLDATETEVYGRDKQGAARSRTGALAYNSYVVTWAQRGRALTSELVGGNQSRISAAESARMIARATALLCTEHGQVTVRGDSGFYSAELMMRLRAQRVRFTLSAPRTTTMWRALHEIPEDAWADATQMRGAQVAETTFAPDGFEHEPLRLIVRRVAVSAAEIQAGSPKARRRSTIPADQLAMVLDGQLASTYAYSFIATDIPDSQQSTIEVEHYHRQRAQIEERFKDAKLGQPLRHLPSGDLDANRLWLTSCLLALNITAMICDISPAASASGTAPDATPLRRHAKALRQILFCVPARITRTARQTIVHLADGFRHLHVFQATYAAVYALGAP
ncbi:MAG: IS1380 family transposase [Actinobacteria bacterium]|nr:IS1380 family transposase [Actinomycetota bacterium]